MTGGGTAETAAGQAISGGSGGSGGTGGGSLFGGTGGFGGGGGIGLSFSGSALTNEGTVTGGIGGTGGTGGTGGRGGSGHGGFGGGGGIGLSFSGGALTNEGTVTGGTGGIGGYGGGIQGIGDIGGIGGDGGGGGIGLSFSGGALTNEGTITGGAGGLAGIGHDLGGFGRPGNGGTGIVAGPNVTIINSGLIAGGTGAGGQANAIEFAGGSNRLELRDGYGFTGNVVANGSDDTLALGGDTSPSIPFDVSAVGGSGQYQGFETFEKTGASIWTVTGSSTTAMPWTVAGGTLVVNGALTGSAVTVLGSATLAGAGTVGATTIQSGATIAPGNSIGTLTVNGNVVLAPGSTYEVEIGGNGSSDRIAASGTATVTGSQVDVTALDPQTSYTTGQRYTIVTAVGGVNGTFAGAATQSAFLDLTLDHQPNEVDLVIAIKKTDPDPPAPPGPPDPPDPPGPPAPPDPPGPDPVPRVFDTVAATRNQIATAVALDTLPQVGGTLALYNSLLMLDAPGARAAFDSLSGEIHASAKSALIDESWLLRNAVNDRLRSAFGSVGAQAMATLNYGFTADLAPSATGPMPRLNADRFAVWGQGYGSWGRTESDRNAAKLTRSSGGFLLGADAALFDTLRFGVIAGYSHSEFDVKGRLSSGESDNYHLGLYGGGQWGALSLRTGASYTWHDISTSRTVAFAGFGDGLKADYNAGTAQVFGEVGYRIDLGHVALEPFAGLAYVNLHTDGFSEKGGAAALSGRSDDISLGYSTLGLRASTRVALQGMDLTLRGGLAWRHAFGDVHPTATLAFAGSNPFSVAGVPIVRDAAVVEAGLDLAISRSASLAISYAGQLAQDTQDHAFKGVLAVRF